MTRKPSPPIIAIRPDGLQIDEQRGQQERYWRIQRAGWWGFSAIVLLAMLGLTGAGGPFQGQTVSFGSATVDLPRVTRRKGADSMSVTFLDRADRHDLGIAQPFFDRFSIARIQPEPAETRLVQGGQQMVFPAAGDAPHVVTFDLRAVRAGWMAFDLSVGGQTRTLSLLVLP